MRNFGELGYFIKTLPLPRSAIIDFSNTFYIHYGDIHSTFNGFINADTYLPNIEDLIFEDIVLNGDLIFADASEDYENLGKTALIENTNQRKIISGLHTHAFRPNKNLISPLYLKYYTDSPSFRIQMRKRGQGISVLGISKTEINKIQVSFPSYGTQLKYSNGIKNVDNKIALLEDKLENLKLFKIGLIDLIINKMIAKKKLIQLSKYYIRASEGGTPSTKISEYYQPGKIPFIKVDDLTNKYLSDVKDYITELGLTKSSAWIVPKDSIIYSNGATIGNISINKLSVSTKQGILGIVLRKSMIPEFVYYLMSSTYFNREIHRITTRGTMKTAYIKDVSKIFVPEISLIEQATAIKSLNSLDNKLEKLKINIENLKQFNL